MPCMVHSKEVVYLGSRPRLFDDNNSKKRIAPKPKRTESIAIPGGLGRKRSPSNLFGTTHSGPPPIPVLALRYRCKCIYPFPLPSYHFRSHHLNSALLESIGQSEILPAGPHSSPVASAQPGRSQPSVWKYSADNSRGDAANTGKMDGSQTGLFGLQLRIIYEQ